MGTVIAVRPRWIRVRVGKRDVGCDLRKGLLRRIRGQRSPIAVGDRVSLVIRPDGRGVLHEILPRNRCISRLGSLRPRREQVIAANVDQLLGLQAMDLPRFNHRGLDRLLVLGEAGGVDCGVCLNKVDLAEKSAAEDLLRVYREIGYPVFPTSAIGGQGLCDLALFLRGKKTLMLGPSGVGKSTLLNQLIPGLRLRVGMVSAATRRGVHTTVRVDYVELPDGGVVLDSPGLRAIQPWTSPEALAEHFPEMRSLLGSCRYRNCLHRGEPDCAVRAAAEMGGIDAARYESYLRILEGLLVDEKESGTVPRLEPKGE